MQQTLPHGRRGIVVAALIAPRFRLVGIGKIAVAIGVVVIPHGSGKEFPASAVILLLFLVEVGAAAIGIGIEAQFGVDEIIHKRRHIDIPGIAFHGIGKVIRLYHLFHRVHIALNIGPLLGLQVFLLGIDARPDDLARHDSLANARHFRGEGGVLVVEGVDAQQVAARQLASAGVALLQLADVHAVLVTFDGFAQDVDAAILAVHRQLAHHCPRCPVAHVAPQLEGQRVAHHRDVVVRCQQYPFTVGRHAQQTHVQLLAVCIARFYCIFLLIEA